MLGEEEGDDGTPVRWIVDPIDGTRNFLRGIPIWATLLALERDGRVVCGVVSAPALGHRWWASLGAGAFRDGDPLQVSRVASLADATVCATYAWDLAAVEQRVWHARGFGDFWQHMLVAEGVVDAAIDAELAIWDYSAIAVVVEEAGGRVTTTAGGVLEPDVQVLSSNGALHADVLALL